jgi:hypothetical protein
MYIDLSKKTIIFAFGICSRIVAVVPNVALMVFDIISLSLLMHGGITFKYAPALMCWQGIHSS